MTTSLLRLHEQWKGHFQGRLLATGDEGYESARKIWNGMIDRRPALIARCVDTADVVAAVRLAREHDLTVSVRGGGHSVAGTAVCDDGLMIDLSPMKDMQVNAAARETTAGPGLTWGEFDAATVAHGLATTGGQVSHTGIAGLTLGGGLGYLMGLHGAACDNLLSAELVTAAGERLTTSEEENADLFWAIRGGGGNFGIATSFRYRLHPIGMVLAGLVLHPRERAAEVIAHYREFVATSPDELDTSVALLNTAEGMPAIAVIAVYAGDPARGEEVLRPLRSFGSPIADLIQPMPYTAAQRMADHLVPPGNRYYWKSNFVDEISESLTSRLIAGAAEMPSKHSIILLFEVKGAFRRVDRSAMAFDHRDANFEMSIIANWIDAEQDAANIAWAREVWSSAQPHVSSAVYSNHLSGDEGQERLRAAYGPAKYARLAEIKYRYDPTNFFRLNHNIKPAEVAAPA